MLARGLFTLEAPGYLGAPSEVEAPAPLHNRAKSGRRYELGRKRGGRRSQREPSTFDRARDELFRAIRQCGVIEAAQAEREEWMADTLRFMAERHPELKPVELEQLRIAGLRFCDPVIPHGKEHTALTLEDANAA
jgi:hypothetical protein